MPSKAIPFCDCGHRHHWWRGPAWLAIQTWLIARSAPTVGIATDEARQDLNLQIRPLLSDRCHRPDAGSRKELDDGWAVVKPGAPDKSELIRRIFTANDDDLMPPLDSHLSLVPAEKELLQRWVVEGAEYQSHWSFIPVGKITPPTPGAARWARTPVDSFIPPGGTKRE